MYLLVNLGEVSLLWMWKTRDLFKKTRDTKGTFHAKRSTVKDRNGIDLTEAEDIKKRWQEYTEGLYKKDIHNPDNYDGVITHLEPDILEFEVKWVLGSITTNKAMTQPGSCQGGLSPRQLCPWALSTTRFSCLPNTHFSVRAAICRLTITYSLVYFLYSIVSSLQTRSCFYPPRFLHVIKQQLMITAAAVSWSPLPSPVLVA